MYKLNIKHYTYPNSDKIEEAFNTEINVLQE